MEKKLERCLKGVSHFLSSADSLTINFFLTKIVNELENCYPSTRNKQNYFKVKII